MIFDSFYILSPIYPYLSFSVKYNVCIFSQYICQFLPIFVFWTKYIERNIFSPCWIVCCQIPPSLPIFAFQPQPPQVISFIVPTYKNRSVTRFRRRSKFISWVERSKLLFIIMITRLQASKPWVLTRVLKIL